MKPFYPTPIGVIGANGRIGFLLCQKLLEARTKIIAFTRHPNVLRQRFTQAESAFVEIRSVELSQKSVPHGTFRDVMCIVNTAHARFLPLILKSTSVPIIALGSTRKFTRWPDDHALGVMKGEEALQADPRPSIILHPTMIYGSEGENNVQRLASLLRYLPIVPLPERGRSLVQPIEQYDVIRCLCAALTLLACQNIKHAESIVIAGAERVSYRQFIALILRYSGRTPRLTISVPAKFLMALSYITAFVPGIPMIKSGEIRRLLENKDADITAMRQRLGIQPINLTNGLAKLFAYPTQK